MQRFAFAPWAVLGPALLLLTVAGCAQTTGDLGRARNTVWERQLAPAYDQLAEGWARGNMTNLPETPKEREMRDRMWRYYAMPLKGQLLLADNRILTRSAILSKKRLSERTDRYYKLLRAENYRSTPALYRRIGGDMDADLAMMPGLFRAICAVRKNDERRQVALGSFAGLDQDARANLAARIDLNGATISQFAEVLQFRYQSYVFALEHLLAEEPDPLGGEPNLKLADVRASVSMARAGRYCAMPSPVLRGTSLGPGTAGTPGRAAIVLGG